MNYFFVLRPVQLFQIETRIFFGSVRSSALCPTIFIQDPFFYMLNILKNIREESSQILEIC